MPEQFTEMRRILSEDRSKASYEVEEQILEFDHSLVGSYLAQKWNLPPELANAIKFHHFPDQDENQSFTTYIIHLSDYLAKKAEMTMEDPDEPVDSSILSCHASAWEKLGIGQDQEENLIQLLRTEYTKAETFLNMARGM